MFRKLILGLTVGVGLSVFPLVAQAVIYSPSQAELGSVSFVDYWAGNGATLNSITNVGSNGVQYNFNTGFASPTPDTFSRSQWQAPFTTDLTGKDAFSIDFQVPAGGSVNGSALSAQVFLLYTGGGSGRASVSAPINATGLTSVSIPLSTLPAGTLSQITNFGIEIFSNGDPAPFGVDVGDKVNAFTSPQPPTYADTFRISDFEGTGSGSLDNWGASFQPDHVSHTVVSTGATHGTHALEINRKFTGADFPAGSGNINFRWGSQMSLNAALPGPTGDYNNNGAVDAADYTRWRDQLGQASTLQNRDAANTGNVNANDYTSWKTNFGHTGGGADPAIQTKINQTVDAINAGDRIAMDVTFTGVDNFPTGTNPGYLVFHLFIQDGTGAFWQSDAATLGEFLQPPANGQTITATLTADLSSFTDRSTMPIAGNLLTHDLQKNTSFTFGLASNTNGDAIFDIDNIRVQKIAPGAGSASAVPEPSAVALALAGVVCGLIGFRRRK